MSTDLNALNERFAIPGRLTIEPGLSDLPVARIRNEHAVATVAFLGAHVTAYQPHDQPPVLFMSARSHFEEGQAIRGGVPVCWPWFGPNDDPHLPMHGIARTRSFTLTDTSDVEGGATRLTLTLTDSPETLKVFPHAFSLQMIVTVGKTLKLEMVTRHEATRPLPVSNALHTYFHVANAADTRIRGLEGCAYIDKMDGMQRKIQSGPVTIEAETDRVYHHTADTVIEDPALGRCLRIAKSGSASTVVWNPWVDKAKAMPDFGDDEFATMLCVETANALDDTLSVPPHTDHRMTATISTEPLN